MDGESTGTGVSSKLPRRKPSTEGFGAADSVVMTIPSVMRATPASWMSPSMM